ncbi:hypothetical protein SAMN02745131_03944 [Flavisolibacter ginsengisoli DSM 18119]|jgi:hypothetical protein|uniref:DUF1648 domain-containing protein n=1 Tax=Flavisolibacter ginsengisoli DSM 18119 TaxID=1121884 RepID=A0A1M5FV95_9BACT|nr:hypothetical protein SAMN02745131_03944 [Flavisolibacter ginsengisoli DSM 18119]
MNFIYKLFAIIYRTYDDRGLDIPHFRAITTIVFLFFLNIVSVILIFDIPSKFIIPWSSDESKGIQWFKASLYFGLPILLISTVFNPKKLDKVPVTDSQIYRGRKILPVCLTLSIILLMALLIRLGIRKGTIHF